MPELPEKIADQIREIVRRHELVLLEASIRGQRNSAVLDVVVDSRDYGVDLDRLTRISRDINEVLDADEDAIKGRYRLDVSTAGLDRPLEHDWQFRKNVGRLMKIKSAPADEPANVTTETCRLLEVNDGQLRLQPMKSRSSKKHRGGWQEVGEPTELEIARIEKATVEPEF